MIRNTDTENHLLRNQGTMTMKKLYGWIMTVALASIGVSTTLGQGSLPPLDMSDGSRKPGKFV